VFQSAKLIIPSAPGGDVPSEATQGRLGDCPQVWGRPDIYPIDLQHKCESLWCIDKLILTNDLGRQPEILDRLGTVKCGSKMTSLPSSTDVALDGEEQIIDKLARKAREQPLVPIGIILTCGALHMSARAIRSGNSQLANRMFYWRVGLQGFTVAALVIGGYFYGKPNRPTDRDAILRNHAKEREKLWIQELERVDEETNQRRARALAIQKKKEELKKEFNDAEAKLQQELEEVVPDGKYDKLEARKKFVPTKKDD
jgi:hypothetical protein